MYRKAGIERDLPQFPEAAVDEPKALFEAPSIAVLPFDCVGDTATAEALASGVAEELVVALSRFQGFAVVSRQSTMRYKGTTASVDEVAGALGVRFVVTGTVRQVGDTIRVAVQVTDGTDSSQLWAHSYQRDLSTSSVFENQDYIVRHLLAQVADPYGGPLAAYQTCLETLKPAVEGVIEALKSITSKSTALKGS